MVDANGNSSSNPPPIFILLVFGAARAFLGLAGAAAFLAAACCLACALAWALAALALGRPRPPGRAAVPQPWRPARRVRRA